MSKPEALRMLFLDQKRDRLTIPSLRRFRAALRAFNFDDNEIREAEINAGYRREDGTLRPFLKGMGG